MNKSYVSYNKKKDVYTCKKCKMVFPSKIEVLQHLFIAHRLVSRLKIEPKGKKGYKTTVITKKTS